MKELPLVWLRGALLEVGDALQRNNYFDHAPELELIYHLRDGIAHGNRFKFTTSGLERLGHFPAHNRNCYQHSIFEITPTLDGSPDLTSDFHS